ncbi:MAG: hypothetical protein GQ533_01405 [Methanosarcinaceae archaeon]|nr:hypothetical protein [Methanosarcinaceae archaeon]
MKSYLTKPHYSYNHLDLGHTPAIYEVKRCDGTPNRNRAAEHDVPSLNNSIFIRNLINIILKYTGEQ